MEEKIKQALKKGPRSNKELQSALELKPTKSGYDSTLDRKLQKLKKTGQVKVADGRWMLTSFDICATCSGRGWTPKGNRSSD